MAQDNSNSKPESKDNSKADFGISERRLKARGLTKAAMTTLVLFFDRGLCQILERAVQLAKIETPEGADVTITCEHISKAWYSVHPGLGHPTKPSRAWRIVINITLLLSSALVGAASGYLHQPCGVLVFGLALSVVVVVSVYKMLNSHSE